MCYTGKCKYESSGDMIFGAGECTIRLGIPFGKEGNRYPDDAQCVIEGEKYVENCEDQEFPDSQKSGDKS